MSPFTSVLAQVMHHHHHLLGMLEPLGSPGQTLDHSHLLLLATRALRGIFCMCKTIASVVNENHRDIQAIKAHMSLPVDAHDELLTFDDPFAEWDTANAAPVPAYVPLPRQRRRQVSRTAHVPHRPPSGQEIFDEDEEMEEEEPQGYHEHRDSDEDDDTSDDIPDIDE